MKIEVSGITKKIKDAVVLEDINMQMESGKIYGLRGKNGSGKTMLMRIICGLVHPTQGEVRIDGMLLGKDISFPPDTGALIENPGFINRYSGYQNLKVLADIQNKADDASLIEVLKKVGLDPYDKKKYKKFSLGMKQKLGIAAAIAEEPQLLVLDEPTNALDEGSVEQLRSILQEFKEKGRLVILSCHDTQELESMSDRIYHLENGRLKEIKEIEK